jgi:hypothetical protein
MSDQALVYPVTLELDQGNWKANGFNQIIWLYLQRWSTMSYAGRFHNVYELLRLECKAMPDLSVSFDFLAV